MSNKESAHPSNLPGAAQGSDGDSAEARYERTDSPETVPANTSHDVETDPALNDGLGQDWSDEGGATPQGPATSSE